MYKRTSLVGIYLIIYLLFISLLSVYLYDRQVKELTEINEGLVDTIEMQRQSYDKVIKEYEDSYKKLEEKYSELLKENTQLKEQMNEVEIPTYEFTPEEIYTLAQCVEAEAGHYSKHKNSQKYITQVILNRLHSGKFPNTIEKVIYQKKGNIPQFSVAYNGMMNREVEPETLANVYSVLVHGTNLPENVLYFYADYVEGNWVNTLNIYDVVEGTVFAYK